LFAFGQEVKGNFEFTRLFVGDSSNKPTISVPFLSCYTHVFSDFAIQRNALFPVHGYIPNELKAGLSFVILREITSHLNRAVDDNIKGKLLSQGRFYCVIRLLF